MKKLSKSLDQKGAVSLLTVVIFATIVTVSVAAYIHSAITQQTEASNYDYGTRAYYAAESGVQDAVRAINTSPAAVASKTNKCQPLLNGGSTVSGTGQLGIGVPEDFNLSYTCQIINTTPTELTGTVSDSSNNTVLLNPDSPTTSTYSAVLSWSKPGPTNSTVLRGKSDTSKALYPYGAWNDGGTRMHPMMRVSIVAVPKEGRGALNQNSFKERTLFLNPVTNASSEAATQVNITATQPREQVIANAQCYPSDGAQSFDGYFCQRQITLTGYNFTTDNIYVRLHSIYGETNYSLALKDSSGSVAKLSKSQATIDVTGRSSNVYRRVKQTVPINGTQTDNWPEAALVAGDGICKLFKVGTVSSQFQTDCDPLGN